MPHARFIHGSTMKHIMTMSLSNATGITALFVVDMLDLFFLSLLGEKHLAAAVGYAGTLLFLTTSVGIGLSIATGALVAKAIGARNKPRACRYMVNVLALALILTSIIALTVRFYIPEMLSLIGAQGEVLGQAALYLNILIPSMPVLALAMCFGAGLRAVGDARRSMFSTLIGGGVNAVLDPIFIFALDMGIEGAATASVFARIAILITSAHGVINIHQLFCPFKWYRFSTDGPIILKVAVPAILTNLATPFSSAYLTRSIAEYGDGFVAGYAIIGRIIPVAFGVVFALSGAIGPIIGQNYGAKLIPRVQQSLKNAYFFSFIYITFVSILIYLLQGYLVQMFSAKDNAALLVYYFCSFIAITFVFNGWLFVANASFNNLGKPILSTILNWGKATIGTIPFVTLGASYDGAFGILLGSAVGGILFALLAVFLSFHIVHQLETTQRQKENKIITEPTIKVREIPLSCNLNPLSSDCVQMCQLAEEAECEEHLFDEQNK